MGVSYNETEQSFVFDFGHDGIEDIVSLTGNGYQIEAFGKCFYYGYEFADHVNHTWAIHQIPEIPKIAA